MTQGLAEILEAAARGRFPAPDGRTRVVPQPSHRDAGVLACTAHSVVFTEENPDWVREALAETHCDELAATMNARFLTAFMARTGRSHDAVDLLTVADALPGDHPPLPLTEIADPEHPRVAYARRRRDEVRVWAAEGGILILGRGVAGRWETAIEVSEEERHRGLGRQLALAARHLVPGEHVWSQQTPGNARSVRVFQAAGYRPIGSEALLLPPR